MKSGDGISRLAEEYLKCGFFGGCLDFLEENAEFVVMEYATELHTLVCRLLLADKNEEAKEAILRFSILLFSLFIGEHARRFFDR